MKPCLHSVVTRTSSRLRIFHGHTHPYTLAVLAHWPEIALQPVTPPPTLRAAGCNESLQGSVRSDGEAELAASLLAQFLLLVLLALPLALLSIPDARCLVSK